MSISTFADEHKQSREKWERQAKFTYQPGIRNSGGKMTDARNAGYFALGVSSYNRNIGSKMMERTR